MNGQDMNGQDMSLPSLRITSVQGTSEQPYIPNYDIQINEEGYPNSGSSNVVFNEDLVLEVCSNIDQQHTNRDSLSPPPLPDI